MPAIGTLTDKGRLSSLQIPFAAVASAVQRSLALSLETMGSGSLRSCLGVPPPVLGPLRPDDFSPHSLDPADRVQRKRRAEGVEDARGGRTDVGRLGLVHPGGACRRLFARDSSALLLAMHLAHPVQHDW